MPMISGTTGSRRRRATWVSFCAPQSRPWMKPSALSKGRMELLLVGAGCGSAALSCSMNPLGRRKLQKEALPACGLSF
jgi:hypothetical protein